MRDYIFIQDLRLDLVIGIHPWEKAQKQPIYLTLKLYGDLATSAASEQISDAINYKEISDRIISWSAEQQIDLIETLAEEVCQLIFKQDPKVKAIELTLNKPMAIEEAKATGLFIYRENPA